MLSVSSGWYVASATFSERNDHVVVVSGARDAHLGLRFDFTSRV
jgi:hypothetical protein